MDHIEQNFHRANHFVRLAVDVMRYMGLSITPKVHGIEDHIVMQMKANRGRIGKLIENWIEQYHQTGLIIYIWLENMKMRWQELKEKREKKSMNPGAINTKETVTKNFC